MRRNEQKHHSAQHFQLFSTILRPQGKSGLISTFLSGNICPEEDKTGEKVVIIPAHF